MDFNMELRLIYQVVDVFVNITDVMGFCPDHFHDSFLDVKRE